jgi:hypothetical protein
MEAMTSADLSVDFDVANFREPTFHELLADPLTLALMAADHVDREDLERRFRCKITRGGAARPTVSFKSYANPPIRGGGPFVVGAIAKAPRAESGSCRAW